LGRLTFCEYQNFNIINHINSQSNHNHTDMSEISNSRKSNVSEIWEDTGWIKDGAAVLKKVDDDPEQEDTGPGSADTDNSENTQTRTT